MKSPSERKIIHIDITNACMRQCLSRIRFRNQLFKLFAAGFSMLKMAVDSMA